LIENEDDAEAVTPPALNLSLPGINSKAIFNEKLNNPTT